MNREEASCTDFFFLLHQNIANSFIPELIKVTISHHLAQPFSDNVPTWVFKENCKKWGATRKIFLLEASGNQL